MVNDTVEAFLDVLPVFLGVVVVVGAFLIGRYWKHRGPLALLVLIIPTCLIGGCRDDSRVDGFDADAFKPHEFAVERLTPAGHVRDGFPLQSVASGFVTDQEIDQAVDAGFAIFGQRFPEFACPNPRVGLFDDYVLWAGQWAGGVCITPREIVVCIWARGESPDEPAGCFIKRAPDGNYPFWRYSARSLCPAIAHELLHCVIGDPGHGRAEWSRL